MRSLISTGGNTRHRSVYRVLLFVLLAFCSFGIEDIESEWGPAPAESTRNSNRHQRGRITRTAAASPHVFRTVYGQDDHGNGPAMAELAPLASDAVVLPVSGAASDALPGHWLAGFVQAPPNRGPPSFSL